MFQIQQTASLFSGQKVFRISKNVENKNQETIKAVVVYESVSENLSSAFQEMLDKLMKACKFNPNEVLFLNIKVNEVSIGQIQSSFNPQLVLLFLVK